MTKRHYVAIAASIRATIQSFAAEGEPDFFPDGAAVDAITLTVRNLADVFKADNPRFRYDTFFEACGLDSFGNLG